MVAFVLTLGWAVITQPAWVCSRAIFLHLAHRCSGLHAQTFRLASPEGLPPHPLSLHCEVGRDPCAAVLSPEMGSWKSPLLVRPRPSAPSLGAGSLPLSHIHFCCLYPKGADLFPLPPDPYPKLLCGLRVRRRAHRLALSLGNCPEGIEGRVSFLEGRRLAVLRTKHNQVTCN